MSELKMYQLSDFCLLNVFQKLNHQDLYSMALSCKRFLEIANMAFNSKFETAERLDEKILRVFGNKIKHVTIKLRTYGEPPQFAKQNLLEAYNKLQRYCPNLETCRIMLAKTYNDFNSNSSNNTNWYNDGYLDKTHHNHGANVFISINCEQDVHAFIEQFVKYLKQNTDVPYDFGDFAGVRNFYEELQNNSDLVKSFALYDYTRDMQLLVIGQSLTNVKIEITDYNFDSEMLNYALDQYETVSMVQKYCPNINTLKIQLIDVNIFRRKSFQTILRKLRKLHLSLLNETADNFHNIEDCIKNLMGSCIELKSLTLQVSKSSYIKPFLNASYQNIEKVTIVSAELYNNDLITSFKNINRTVKELKLLSKFIRK